MEKMKIDIKKKALELEAGLLQEISYQEGVLDIAGECYEGHNKDVQDLKNLLKAIREYTGD